MSRLTLAVALLLAPLAIARAEGGAPANVVVRGATIEIGDGTVVEGDLFVRGGKIHAVGAVKSGDAEVLEIDATGLRLIPGLIDARSSLLAAGARHAGAARYDARDDVDLWQVGARDALRRGVTTVVVVPGDEATWGGRIAVAKLGEPGRILDEPGGIKATIGVTRPGRRRGTWVAPTAASVRGEIKNLVGTLKRASAYDESWKKHRAAHAAWTKAVAAAKKSVEEAQKKGKPAEPAKKPAKEPSKEPAEPKLDAELEALGPVVRKEIPLRVEVHGIFAIRGALDAARQAGVRIVLDAASGIGAIADEIPETVPVVVSVRGWGGPREAHADPADAGALARAGVPVAVASFGPAATRASALLDLAAVAVREGLPAERALRALTVDAAAAIGMERRLGRIAKGRDADVVALDGDPFDPATQVVWVMIDGQIQYRREP